MLSLLLQGQLFQSLACGLAGRCSLMPSSWYEQSVEHCGAMGPLAIASRPPGTGPRAVVALPSSWRAHPGARALSPISLADEAPMALAFTTCGLRQGMEVQLDEALRAACVGQDLAHVASGLAPSVQPCTEWALIDSCRCSRIKADGFIAVCAWDSVTT